ncbi:MAG: biopolymer transporter ExbD [Planctomycetota bacterium]|nr:biopolymer transporter ExbD [Planctomycetota bacterium]MDE1889652.1 biopolymer transporter ExbD [Planctomycetota bacterium]MDE2217430.1 biopolymer transporter ExbD [Planctomycetota bacterium]
MKIPLPTTRRKARIEIIPLIDVIFFLLATFVMVSLSMVKNQGIRVNLPSAATGATQEREAAVTITVTKSGDIYLNQVKLAPDLLPQRLKQLKAENPDMSVFINGDKEAYFGNAIQILDEVRSSGITKVAIQTKQAEPLQK